MKKVFSVLVIASAFTLFSATTAKADGGERRLTGYTECGKPIFAFYEVVGRDHCGHAIRKWVKHVPQSCHCDEHGHDHG